MNRTRAGRPRTTVALSGLLLGAVLLLAGCDFDLIGAERDGEVRTELIADESAIGAPPAGETSVQSGTATMRYRVTALREDGGTVGVTNGIVESTAAFGEGYRAVAAASVRPGAVAELVLEVFHVSVLIEQGRVLGNPATGVFEVAIAETDPVVLRWQAPFDVSPGTQHRFRIDLNAHEWLELHVGRIVPATGFRNAVRLRVD